MSAWSNRAARPCRDGGNVAIEFALVVPVLILLMTATVEIGRAHFQATAVEKGLRAGALYAARVEQPLGTVDLQTVRNLVRTGTVDGTGAWLVSGWSAPGADLRIETVSFVVDGNPIPVIRIEADVPFDPILPGLVGWLGLSDFTMTLRHEQAFLGT